MKELDVLCVGLCCIDVLIRGVDLSTPFDAESKHADSTTLSVGGDALNEARVLARLGDRVALQCAVGRDVGAQLIRSAVAESGADICGITAEMDATPMNVVVIQPDGQRNFINTGLLSYGDYDPDPALLSRARVVSLGSLMVPPLHRPERAERIARQAKEAGALVCADCGGLSGGWRLQDFAGVLSQLDFIFPNLEEALSLTGASTAETAAEVLYGFGVKNVVVKTGSRGCYLRSAEGGTAIPTYTHLPVVDTTGAGDNFAAGTIHALLEGKSPAEACRFGNGVASVAIQVIGASTGVKSLAQVRAAISRFDQGLV